jgi:hypothetical protein
MIKTDFERKNGKVIADCLYLDPRYPGSAVAEIEGKYYKADACPGFKDRLTPLPYYYDPLPEWEVKVKRWYFVYGLCPRKGDTDDYIGLAEYARMHGVAPATARQKALRGGFKTAKKLGRDWVISRSEPYSDLRKKTK